MPRLSIPTLLVAAFLLLDAVGAGAQTPVPDPGRTQLRIPKSGSRKKPKKIPYEKRVNLNAATRDELMKVPLIDAETADRIIAGRPYKTTGELLLRNLVPGAHFWTIKEKVTAGPSVQKKPVVPGKK